MAVKASLRILVAYNVSRLRNNGMSRIMGLIHDQLVHAGHTVNYFCAEDVPRGLDWKLSRFTFPVLVLAPTVAAACSGTPYDIINIHEPSAALISSWKRIAGNPVVVVTSHGVEQRGWELALEELRLGRKGPSLKTRLIYPLTSLWQSRMGLQRADHIFCLNYEDRDYLMQRFNISQHKMTRIYPGADRVYADAARERNYARADKLLFAGTWRKNKGVEDLIPAFVRLALRCPNLTLTILGGGAPETTILKSFPESVRSKIHCIQTKNELENASVYASSDIFLLPSLFEGTPLTLIEAMMSGLPVVTTSTCGMKDVIQDERNGLLIPIRSPEAIVGAVGKLLSEVGYRSRLGQAAQAEALEKYTWKRVATLVQDVYRHLCWNKLQ